MGLAADLMRELGLRACQPRAYKRTTMPGEQPVASPDLIGRDFTATAPGTRLVGDITYLKTGEGWLYLATVIDLATRMVTGWQLASHMRTSLVTDALAMAISHGTSSRERCSTAIMPRLALSRGTPACPVQAGLRDKFPGLTPGLSETVEDLQFVCGERFGDRGADRGGGSADSCSHHVQGREGIER